MKFCFQKHFYLCNWQARLQLLNCGLPWQFTMTAESQNLVLPLKGVIQTYPTWFSLVPSKNELFDTHKCHFSFHKTKFVIISLNHIPPESGVQNLVPYLSQVLMFSNFSFHLNTSSFTFLTFHCSKSIKMPFIFIRHEEKPVLPKFLCVF